MLVVRFCCFSAIFSFTSLSRFSHFFCECFLMFSFLLEEDEREEEEDEREEEEDERDDISLSNEHQQC